MRYTIWFFFAVQEITQPSIAQNHYDGKGLVERLALAIDTLEKAEQQNNQFSDNKQNPTQTSGLAGTYCLIKCIQTMQNQEMQFPETQTLDQQFGSWIDGPYNVFLFQAMCGTYVTHKDCVSNCPDSVAKSMTIEAFEPLEYTCVEHYEAFLKHLPCFMKLKPELERKCNLQCGSADYIMNKVAAIQNHPEPASQIVLESLDELCRYSDCQRLCYEPEVLTKCGHDASRVHPQNT